MGSLDCLRVACASLSLFLSCGLSRTIASCETLSTCAVQQPIAGEVEGIDLDLRFLPGMDKADVAVRDHRLDLEMAVRRHDDEQRLRRRHHAADGVDGELLHGAVDRRGQHLQPGLLLRLDQILAQCPAALRSASTSSLEAACADIPPRSARGSRVIAANAASALLESALLDFELLLLLDQRLQHFAGSWPSIRSRGRSRVWRISTRCWSTGRTGFQLADRRRDGVAFGLLLRPSGDRARRAWRAARRCWSRRNCCWVATISAVLAPARRMELRERIAGRSQRGAQPRHVELGGMITSLCRCSLSARVDGRIEFDQHLAGLDLLPVCNVDGTDDAGLERLDDLGRPLGMILPVAVATMSTRRSMPR